MSLIKFGEFIHAKDYYDRDYEAIVVENVDPKKLDRVKVIIPGVLESDDHSKLPYCYPKHQYSIMGRVLIVPNINDKVSVTFPYNDPHFIQYDAYFINKPNALAVTDASLFDVDYPDTQGAKDSSGSYLAINRKTNKQELDYQHSSGIRIRMNKVGRLKIDIPNNWEVEIEKETSIHGKEVIKIYSDDHIELNGNLLESARKTDTTKHICLFANIPVSSIIDSGDDTVFHQL